MCNESSRVDIAYIKINPRISTSVAIVPSKRIQEPYSKKMNSREIDTFFDEALDACREVGKIVKEGFFQTKEVETKSAPWDLVTEYDRKCENILITRLKKAFPTHKFIGEETSSATKDIPKLSADPTWIIDPIDGTTNFVHGLPLTCISIAFSINFETIIGIIYNPILNQEFTAKKGGGAKLNGKPIHTSDCTSVEKSIICHETSFARIESIRERELNRLKALVSKAHGVRSLGCAAISLAYVAWGALDAYHIDALQSWDVAAGDLIVREAGGCVINSDGSKFDMFSKKLLATSTEKLAQEIVEIIAKTDKI